jgi:cell wall assembly regulator SMI1
MPKRNTKREDKVGVAWDAIEATIQEHRPELIAALGKPCTPKQLSALEAVIGRELPAALERSLRIHNGVKDVPRSPRLFQNEKLLSAVEIAHQWRTMESLREQGSLSTEQVNARTGLKAGFWDSAWIPITDNEGDGFHVDTDPGAGGRVGQVLYFWHDGARETRVVAQDYVAWLRSLPERIAKEAAQSPPKPAAKAKKKPVVDMDELSLFLFFVANQPAATEASVLRYRPVARTTAKALLGIALRDGWVIADGKHINLTAAGRDALVEQGLA